MTGLQHLTTGNPMVMIAGVELSYDAVGNKLYRKDLVNGDTRSELYQYDRRNRLRQFQRGELIQQPDGTYAIPDNRQLVHPVLPGRQSWLNTGALDSRGNWLENVVQLNNGVQAEGRTVNGVNEYLEADLNTGASPPDPVALTHDANGNLTCDPTAPNVGASVPLGQRYVYDVENRLTAVWRTEGTEATGDDTLLLEIRYDALNRRVETIERVDTDSGLPLATPAVTRHIHAGLTVIEEYGISGNGTGGYIVALLREFLWGDRFPEPVAMVDHTTAGALPPPGETGGGQEVFHYLLDDLGNVVGLTDAGDPTASPPVPPKLVERYTYDAYGATYIEVPNGSGGWTFTDPVTTQRFARSALGNPFMWTGQRFDPTTKLYHFWARGYSPRLGRWLQRDPIGYADGVSLYEYCSSSPVWFIDPLGLAEKPDKVPEDPQAELDKLMAELCPAMKELEDELKKDQEARGVITRENHREDRDLLTAEELEAHKQHIAEQGDRQARIVHLRERVKQLLGELRYLKLFQQWMAELWNQSVQEGVEYGRWITYDPKTGRTSAGPLIRGERNFVDLKEKPPGAVLHAHTHPHTNDPNKRERHKEGASHQDTHVATERYRMAGYVVYMGKNGGLWKSYFLPKEWRVHHE